MRIRLCECCFKHSPNPSEANYVVFTPLTLFGFVCKRWRSVSYRCGNCVFSNEEKLRLEDIVYEEILPPQFGGYHVLDMSADGR